MCLKIIGHVKKKGKKLKQTFCPSHLLTFAKRFSLEGNSETHLKNTQKEIQNGLNVLLFSKALGTCRCWFLWPSRANSWCEQWDINKMEITCIMDIVFCISYSVKVAKG